MAVGRGRLRTRRRVLYENGATRKFRAIRPLFALQSTISNVTWTHTQQRRARSKPRRWTSALRRGPRPPRPDLAFLNRRAVMPAGCTMEREKGSPRPITQTDLHYPDSCRGIVQRRHEDHDPRDPSGTGTQHVGNSPLIGSSPERPMSLFASSCLIRDGDKIHRRSSRDPARRPCLPRLRGNDDPTCPDFGRLMPCPWRVVLAKSERL